MDPSQRSEKCDPYYRESVDGRARVLKIGINGSMRYEVWKRHGTTFIQHRVNLVSFEDARQIARDDLGADFGETT